MTGMCTLLTYLASYLCKLKHHMVELIKKHLNKLITKTWQRKYIVLVLLLFDEARSFNAWGNTKSIVNAYERFQQLCCLYFHRMKSKRCWNPQDVLEKKNPHDTNIYVSTLRNTSENSCDDLDNLCSADFASSCRGKKADDVTVESEDVENHTFPVLDFCEAPLLEKVIKLKNGLAEMRKHSPPFVIRF